MTRRLFYLRDKLSRQSLLPKLAEFHSTCRIRSLAERERLAPILRRGLASLIDATRLRIERFQTVPTIEVGLLVRTTPQQRRSLSGAAADWGRSSIQCGPSSILSCDRVFGGPVADRRSRCSSNEARRASTVLIKGATDTELSSSPPQEEGDRSRRVPVTLISIYNGFSLLI
jgi:hypothetical protein